MTRSPLLLTGLLALSAASLLTGLASGSVGLGWGELWAALTGSTETLAGQVLWELRMPRTLAAFVTGGLLALAGALMQVLLRNPLADP